MTKSNIVIFFVARLTVGAYIFKPNKILFMKRRMILRTTFLLFLTCGLINYLYAQEKTKIEKIVVRGNAKTQSITCDGEKLIISGDRHKITVKGYCFEIVVYGNESFINLESVRLITLHGNKNKITYKEDPEFKTRINRFGDYNRVDKTE